MGKIKFLGTGASVGVPVVGCSCDICQSSDPRDKRLRAAALISYQGKNYLIDAGPDIREQLLKNGVTTLEAVFLTHTHFDHVAGLDDLRVFSFREGRPLPIIASKESFASLEQRYPYLFSQKPLNKQKFQPISLEKEQGYHEHQDLSFHYFSYRQVGMKVTGFRFGKFAFVTDIKEYDESLFQSLESVETLVLSVLDEKETRAHIGMEEALSIAETLGVNKLYLTHLCHTISHKKLQSTLPNFCQLAYDGLEIDINL